MAPIPRLREYKGPALFSYGFRPFFLFGSIYAGLAILAWLPAFYGHLDLTTTFAPRDWHIHEMLYGYLSAIVAGFLLTAIPNWTGRLPLQGRPLGILVLAWVLGRLAVCTSAFIGWVPAAILDNAFLVLVALAAAREIVKGGNWRNLKILILLSVLVAGNVAFHLEAHWMGAVEIGARMGVAAIMMLIMVIGGRIVPSFTRNWLSRENPGRLPASFGRYDMASMAGAALALVVWIAAPTSLPAALMLIGAGVLQMVRLARWAGDRTWRDRLVLVLHIAYAFVPLGFVLTGLAALGFVSSGAGIHAWTAGAMGVMTLAVMSRASLGHTGRALVATPATQGLYGLLVLAAFARIMAAVTGSDLLIEMSGAAWIAAFLGFVAVYWKVLTGPRAKVG